MTGNANFQFYYVDQDFNTSVDASSWSNSPADIGSWAVYATDGNPGLQDHGWYFGVDEAELQLNVSGAADNGLNYGFKIELNANTTDNAMADEVRLQLSGGWGTLQLGDEDGAEDVMNYGGENLMGATGGFDGDYDDVLFRNFETYNGVEQMAAPSYPTIVGDTSDATKVSYFSPRFSGFQVGASLTPTPQSGDGFKSDKAWENHIGIGANYDNTFGDLRIRASAVYSGASSTTSPNTDFLLNDISAWSVGGIVNWGAFGLGANYTDNGDSGMWDLSNEGRTSESSYWNVAASFETGPLYFSAGYMSSVRDYSGTDPYYVAAPDSTFENIALTVDYTMAPGLGIYAEVDLISDEFIGGGAVCEDNWGGINCSNDATILIMGANVSF
ncbi:MAG: porin [Proteobacteria bacterium]|nr:porin [Pseudomonadota bacterium]